MKYQVTLMCATNQYKPVSCIITRANKIDLKDKEQKKTLINDGIVKICSQRSWTQRDLIKYFYTKIKIREYNPEKIAQENAARYEAIKEAKYASGEWKRPKGKNKKSSLEGLTRV